MSLASDWNVVDVVRPQPGQAFLEIGAVLFGDGVQALGRDLGPRPGRDAVEIPVGGGFRIRQHIFGVEDVEALVLHRAEVEIVDGDDVEHI